MKKNIWGICGIIGLLMMIGSVGALEAGLITTGQTLLRAAAGAAVALTSAARA